MTVVRRKQLETVDAARRFQVEDVVLEQRDAHNQAALPLGRRGAEDVGEDLGGGSGVCHDGRSWDLTRPELYQNGIWQSYGA